MEIHESKQSSFVYTTQSVPLEEWRFKIPSHVEILLSLMYNFVIFPNFCSTSSDFLFDAA